ncbi:MAG: sensor histidine kinase N-terminal domain-containing protein [Rhizobacter sp.]|nr:sensor histidine kinase N-terminal domain-containing protein [Rhizobacter sp.]
MSLPRSLQGRLLVLVLGTVVLLWGAVAALTWRDAQHELDELLDGHLAQAAALLVVQQAVHAEDDDGLADAPSLHRYAPRVSFQVWHEGRLVLRSANAPATPLSRHATGFETLRLNGTAWRVFAARGAEGDVQVYVGERVGARASILWAVMRSLATPMLLGLPLLALAGWWAVRRGLMPLRRLGRQVALREPQALQPIPLGDAPAEMAPLVSALNTLFARIDALLESERRFTADAAHELRTPIAGIRAQAQVALGASQDRERERALHATLAGCDRATHLVEQLLTLSRLEAAAVDAAAATDLADLAQRVLAELAPLALDRQQTLELDAPQPCPVKGEATLLGVLVRNLVDNAIRYAPAGARVQVGVRALANEITFTVDDSGPGLAEAELQRLGERFFRALGTGQSGSGLGWSIVRRIAAVHGAQVDVRRSALLGGLGVAVHFPR